MGSNSGIWHCPDAVVGHSLAASCLSSLAELSERDYPGRHYFLLDIPALDMDTYEHSRPGVNQRTTDAVIGICNARDGNPVCRRLLLVELRMDYQSTRNLSVGEIKDKESHTRQLLRECPDDAAQDSSLCLVFDPEIANLAYSWIKRVSRADKSTALWQPHTPATLVDYINAGKCLTPEAGADTKSICSELDKSLGGNISHIYRLWEKAKKHFDLCLLKYKLVDCAYMAEQMKHVLTLVDSTGFNEEESIMLEIMEDDSRLVSHSINSLN